MSEPGPSRFEELDPSGDIVICGPVRKDKSKNERFAVLWANPIDGGGVARLEVYADEKSFTKKKSPRTKIPIKDIECCEATEANNSPNSRDLNRFVIKFHNGETYYYNCTSIGHQRAWCEWIQEFVTGVPDVHRHGFDKSYPRVKIVAADLALKTGLANGVSQPCTVAFSPSDVGIFFAQRHRVRFSVPVRLLRSAGYSGSLMHFQCGRRTVCGEGFMFFETTSEYDAKLMKESLYEEMSRGVDTNNPESPPVTMPSPSNSSLSHSQSSQHISNNSQYPLNIPGNSASLAYAITQNARPQQPIPHMSSPTNSLSESLPRSMTNGSSGSGSMRAASHRPRAAAVSVASHGSSRHFSRQSSEPAMAGGSSLGRQLSMRATPSSYGSEASEQLYMSPSNRKMSMYEDMHSPFQPRVSGSENQRLSGSGDHQEQYEDMQPLAYGHSRSGSVASETSNRIRRDSGMDDVEGRLSMISVDSQSSHSQRRSIPAGLTDSVVPTTPGLYANKSVDESFGTSAEKHYVNFEPLRTQRSSQPRKHLEVREKGRNTEYENLWVVINNPNERPAPEASNPMNIPPKPRISTPRESMMVSQSDTELSGSWHNSVHPLPRTGPHSSFSGDQGVFHMDETTSPQQLPAHVSQQS